MSDRRQFIAGMVAVGALSTNRLVAGQDEEPKKLDSKMVGQFVAKSHGDMETVKSLLGKEPALVNCAWDWGGGDWETGLGAASHVGRKEIANLLLEKGARLDPFAASMLGMTSVVSEMLKVVPKLHAIPGPHDIPLISHAIFGRQGAARVVEILLDAGADVNAKSKMNMTPLMAAVSVENPDLVEELLRRDADPTAKDTKGVSILDVAKRRKNKKVTELIENAISEF